MPVIIGEASAERVIKTPEERLAEFIASKYSENRPEGMAITNVCFDGKEEKIKIIFSNMPTLIKEPFASVERFFINECHANVAYDNIIDNSITYSLSEARYETMKQLLSEDQPGLLPEFSEFQQPGRGR